MAVTQANVQAAFKETYAGVVPKLFEVQDYACSKIRTSGDVEAAGPRTLRLLKKMTQGGQYRYASVDGGDFGRGSGPTYDVATCTPLVSILAVEFNKSVEYGTAKNAIAIDNVVTDLLADEMEEFKTQEDRQLSTAGNCIIGTISTGAGTTAMTMASPFKTALIRPGSKILSMDSAQAGYRTGNPTVTAVSAPSAGGVVTVDAAFTGGAANGDVLVVDGSTGATPTGLFGFPYHFSTASTGTWMNLNRATYPQIRTPGLSAGTALTTIMARYARNQVEIFRGANAFKTGNWEWYGHQAQWQAYEELAVTASVYDKKGSRDDFDMTFGEAMIDGLPFARSSNADPSALWLNDWENWGRAETVAVDLYDVNDVNMFQIYGASGGIAAAQIFYIINIKQWFVHDPGRAFALTNLSIPANY